MRMVSARISEWSMVGFSKLCIWLKTIGVTSEDVHGNAGRSKCEIVTTVRESQEC